MQPHERREMVESLFRKYGRGVGNYVLARVGSVDLAESITSGVFLIVVERIEQCRSSPAAWLWSIVRSEIARHFRQHRPTGPVASQEPIDSSPQPGELAARREMQIQMRLALESLTDEQQRLIYLKFFQDMSNAEIAEALGLSPSNVGVIIHRAVKRLRRVDGAGQKSRRKLKASLEGRSLILRTEEDENTADH